MPKREEGGCGINFKDIDGEQLLNDYTLFHGNFILSSTSYEEMKATRAELLSRLERGEKAIAAISNRDDALRKHTPLIHHLEKKIENLLSVNEAINKENKILDKTVESLKCCGNCSMDECEYSKSNEDSWDAYCDKWQYDGLNRVDRRIK